MEAGFPEGTGDRLLRGSVRNAQRQDRPRPGAAHPQVRHWRRSSTQPAPEEMPARSWTAGLRYPGSAVPGGGPGARPIRRRTRRPTWSSAWRRTAGGSRRRHGPTWRKRCAQGCTSIPACTISFPRTGNCSDLAAERRRAVSATCASLRTGHSCTSSPARSKRSAPCGWRCWEPIRPSASGPPPG